MCSPGLVSAYWGVTHKPEGSQRPGLSERAGQRALPLQSVLCSSVEVEIRLLPGLCHPLGRAGSLLGEGSEHRIGAIRAHRFLGDPLRWEQVSLQDDTGSEGRQHLWTCLTYPIHRPAQQSCITIALHGQPPFPALFLKKQQLCRAPRE